MDSYTKGLVGRSGPDKDPEGNKTRQVSLVVTSLDWGQLLGQMITPSKETYWERALHLALDLQGILHLAQRVQEEVHQAVTKTEAVVTGEGMEETLVDESSLGDSSSEAETGEGEPGETQGNPDDFFAGLS